MKIKLDENLPSGLVIPLERLGHEVDTVHKENLTGRPDVEVWEAAQQESRFLVTQDLDFSDLRHFSLGSQRRHSSASITLSRSKELVGES